MNNDISNAGIVTIDDMDLNVYSKKGPLKPSYLLAIKEVFDSALQQYPRTLILRVDLKYPNGFSIDNVSSKQITKFQESFKALMCAYLKRKMRKNCNNRNLHSTPRFIWCKEIVTSENPHYHVAVLLNGEVFRGLGPYDGIESNYISGMVVKAWASATGLQVEQASRAITFPRNGRYVIHKRSSPSVFNDQYKQAFYRISYFAKEESKKYGNREKNFGSSRK
ncbi:inovirus Gp2 family protein [Vibrio mimicus]|uniref:inovirus Gp2 family protein n=1 Tax=Vibrio mimicus TaxID=674 RepID=UPI002FF28A76